MSIRDEWDTERPFFEEVERQMHQLGWTTTYHAASTEYHAPNRGQQEVILAGIQALEHQAYQRGRSAAGGKDARS